MEIVVLFCSPLEVSSSDLNLSSAEGVTSLSRAVSIGLLATDAGILEILLPVACLGKINKNQLITVSGYKMGIEAETPWLIQIYL